MACAERAPVAVDEPESEATRRRYDKSLDEDDKHNGMLSSQGRV